MHFNGWQKRQDKKSYFFVKFAPCRDAIYIGFIHHNEYSKLYAQCFNLFIHFMHQFSCNSQCFFLARSISCLVPIYLSFHVIDWLKMTRLFCIECSFFCCSLTRILLGMLRLFWMSWWLWRGMKVIRDWFLGLSRVG